MSHLNFCVETSPYWHYTMDYMMNSITSSGFHNMDFWAASPHYCFMDDNKENLTKRRSEIKSLMKAYELQMPVFSPEQMVKYPFNIASPNTYMENLSMEMVFDYLNDTVEFGAKAMRVGTGWQHLDLLDEKNRERSLANMQKIADRAAEVGIIVLIGTSGKQIGSFASNIDELGKYVNTVDRPNVKAAVSVSEVIDSGSTMEECFEILGDRIGHIYLADRGGQILGKTGGNLIEALETIETHDYQGLIALQMTFRDCILTPDLGTIKSAKWLIQNGYKIK